MSDQNTQSKTTIVNLERLKDTVLFSVTIRRFGNSARIKSMDDLRAYLKAWEDDTTPDEEAVEKPVIITGDRVKSTKTLLRSPRLERLNKAMNALKSQVEAMSVPSFFRAGMFVTKQSNVLAVEKTLKDGWSKIQSNELKDFLDGYPDDVKAAEVTPVKKGGLGPLFKATDYPDREELEKTFLIEWYYMELLAASNVPDELKAEANEKFKQRLEQAAEQMEEALRLELQELIAHAEERLTPTPGEKPKVFRESAIGKIADFIKTFDSRDVYSDEKLRPILEEVKKVLLDEKGEVKIAPQKLRDYPNVRETARAGFAKVREKLDGLIESKGRKLTLED